MADNLNATAPIGVTLRQFAFNTTDYIVFGVMLCISAVIGVYFGFFAKGANTTDEYLMGGRRMKTFPIAVSLVASQLSAIAIMSIPAEIYAYGLHWFFNVVAMIIIVPLLNWVIIPVFYNNNITNCYEYLEMRFNRETRQIQTISFVLTILLVLPIFIFVPSLAFSQVTGYNVHIINTIVCSVCIFYTMFGGIKAVVWTDVVQAAIMVFSIGLLAILGTIKVGGLGEIYRIASEGQRLRVNFTFDATTRSTFWNMFSNAIVLWTSYVGLNQSCVQRVVSLPTLNHAKRSLVLFGLGFIIIMFFNCFTGMVMYTHYHDCDPVTAGIVEKADKLMPFFVQDIVGHISGLPGIFISCVFSAALSTMSANLNSLAGIIYFDYIKPCIRHTEGRANIIMKTCVLIMGIYSIFGGILVANFNSILQMVYTIHGLTFGAVFGVFLLGMLMPRAHGRAAVTAVIISLLTMLIIALGDWGNVNYNTLPLTVQGCLNLNSTIVPMATPTTTASIISSSTTTTATTTIYLASKPKGSESNFNLFHISYNWYVVLGAIITFAVGISLSLILKPATDDKFDPNLLSPIVQQFIEYELTQSEELPDIKNKSKA